jgi:L-ascorbate metabolism protein UlaG (beta-lactamase superfamily)
MDHFNSGNTVAIFKATGVPIIAEAKVTNKLKDKIPADKLTNAESGKTYTIGDITVKAIQGIHLGPIMLYHARMSNFAIFHGGDSAYVPLTEYPSDVEFLPTGRGSPTASPEKAFKMAVDLKPQDAFAMHGSEKQKHQFLQKVQEGLPQTKVIIMLPYSTESIQVKEN